MRPERAAPVTAESLRRYAFALRRQRAASCREDFGAFVEEVVQDDHGHPLRLSMMHRAWDAHVRWCWAQGQHAIVVAHFGSGKSSTLAVPRLAWEVGKDAQARIKVITNDDSNARKRVSGAARLMKSAPYRRVFPWVHPGRKWTEHEVYVQRVGHGLDPSIQARGVLSTGIGGRADMLLFDDVVDQRNAADPVQRRKVLDVIDSTWLSRLEPDGHALMVATLWHLDDATHHLMQRTGWCTLLQRVGDDCQRIEQELIGSGLDTHPLVQPDAIERLGIAGAAG